jgi:flagellar motor switch protein FliN
MFSSPSSLSSSSITPSAEVPDDAAAAERGGVSRFRGFLSVRCSVSVVLGTGTMTVRECLELAPHSVLCLAEAAGEDLILSVGPVTIARGEVVIVDDRTAVRLNEILGSHDAEARA